MKNDNECRLESRWLIVKKKQSKCKCCGKTGDWTIAARNGQGVVCEECYEFINAPVSDLNYADEEQRRLYHKQVARAVIKQSYVDLLYYRRYKSGHRLKSLGREKAIIEAGVVAETFYGDLYGNFTFWCYVAELPPMAAKRRLKNLTTEDVYTLLKTKNYNTVKQRKKRA